MLNRTFMPMLAAAVTTLVAAPRADAETIVVGKEANSIQAAVDAALANTDAEDVILVPGGTYDESVLVSFAALSDPADQQSLTLKTQGKGKAVVRGVGGTALRLDGAAGVRLERLVLDSGSAADGLPALLIGGKSKDIEISKVDGVPGDDMGAVLLGANVLGVRFVDCDFSGMLATGFRIDGFGHELIDCKANACGMNGIVFTDQALNCLIEGCTVDAASGSTVVDPGMITIRGNGHRIIDTDVSGAGIHGIWLEGAGHLVENCDASDNAEAGFHLMGAQITVRDSTASGNLFGLQGGGLGATVVKSTFKDNLSHGVAITEGGTNLHSIKSIGNGGHGVHVAQVVLGTSILGSTLQKNTGEGLVVEGRLTWVEKNKAKKNDGLIDLGIDNGGRKNVVKNGAQNDF